MFLAVGAVASLTLCLIDVLAPPVESLTGLILLVAIAFGFVPVWIVSIVNAYRSARRDGVIELGRYNRWYVYVAILLAAHLMLLLFENRGSDFELFHMPARSMLPTMQAGDYFVLAGSAYRDQQPERGDVAVFKLPSGGETSYIKRIVGLPGDHIQMRDGRLYISGDPVKRERLGPEVTEAYEVAWGFLPSESAEIYREALPNGVSYDIIEVSDKVPLDNTSVYMVPPGHYFALGDNRDNSQDSRTSMVGFIPAENLVGRAKFVFYSTAAHNASFLHIWRWLPATRMDRIGARIQ
ncbi:signal peptidase I [Virgifigura deserti]|uniref:signal peptidase I n=1 Tax=Virgifigura deserti TaxID=2268457 RepID=UPI003CCBE764